MVKCPYERKFNEIEKERERDIGRSVKSIERKYGQKKTRMKKDKVLFHI
jgi:hypothetical protein